MVAVIFDTTHFYRATAPVGPRPAGNWLSSRKLVLSRVPMTASDVSFSGHGRLLVQMSSWPCWNMQMLLKNYLCCRCHSSCESLRCVSWGGPSYTQLAGTCHRLCMGFCPRDMRGAIEVDLLWQKRHYKSKIQKSTCSLFLPRIF